MRASSWAPLAVGILLAGCADSIESEPDDALAYPDVLDLTGMPDSARDASVFAFGDLGAWHMFGLPSAAHGEALGGFTGPLLLTEGGRWIGQSLVAVAAWPEGEGERLVWVTGDEGTVASYPGRLHQELSAGDIHAVLDLVFVSERSALVRAVLSNHGAQVNRIVVGWAGDAALGPARMTAGPQGVRVEVAGSGTVVDVHFSERDDVAVSQVRGAEYSARGQVHELAPGDDVTRYVLVSAYENAVALEADQPRRDAILVDPVTHLEAQARRWDGYLASVMARLPADAVPVQRRVAAKAVETLISNWRSPLGGLHFAGLFPSYAYRGFHGVWSWDSWKHARALALFAPELAKDQMRVMLDWQDEAGMIPDVIYADSTENNWRDTKPPLAAWAVAGILDATHDTTFVREVYPALTAYHAWWYAHRDHDGNGLCEYGSTDGTRIAAAWESGMDNAVRFDSAVMVENHAGAWSLDQESVDLNAYLYAEKGYLAGLADAVGLPEEARRYRSESDTLAQRIRDVMFDEDTGFFYDVRLGSGERIPVQGPEGWIPLWAGVATPEQARRVAAVMMDPARFFTKVPLPTLSMARPEFDPTDGYWRGPVWLDQAYFGVRGLERYGLVEEAAAVRTRLLTAPVGLSGQGPIFENYDPRTGEGINAPHFSWSAAHLLMLLDAGDGRRP